MDKTIEQVFRAFSHIAREIQLYFIPGFLILLNIYAVDFFYYKNSISYLIEKHYFSLIIIVVSYVLGHVCMALYYVLIEHFGIDKKINAILKFDYKVESDLLPKLYRDDKESYFHFIERYAILTLMRWTMSASFFVIFVTDTVYLSIKPYKWQIFTLASISFFSSIFMLILTNYTEKDYAGKIKSMSNVVDEFGKKTNSNKF
ncbi:MAG: hypothetical protein AB1568_09880 [Thermodesulfobacteriota bacterium]